VERDDTSNSYGRGTYVPDASVVLWPPRIPHSE
jgi:hypothetical protein